MRKMLWIAGMVMITMAACNNPTIEFVLPTISNADTSVRAGCFLHTLNKDSTFLELTLHNGKATGKFYWLPDQKHVPTPGKEVLADSNSASLVCELSTRILIANAQKGVVST